MRIFLLLDLLCKNKHLFTDIMEHLESRTKICMNQLSNFGRKQNFWYQLNLLDGVFSVYEDVTVIGFNAANQAFIYRYNGSIWNQEQILNESSVSFLKECFNLWEFYGEFTVIGAYDANQAFIYEASFISHC
ncbi:hypothetical protein M0811_13518 [Anaeramoeba ignava]|uniref:Uncharacterized protein n=1 Tax=Anaeramoeba ignava TaxID=1746090 RepID=A0A9Q0R525_ANAIG|nr:hypothetical protein M0811_13518 [Anaeramoeba ignava]